MAVRTSVDFHFLEVPKTALAMVDFTAPIW